METRNKEYDVRYYDLSNLKGISDRTLEMHFKLYRGYVEETNRLTQRLAGMISEGGLDPNESPAYSELKRHLAFEYDGMILHEYYFGNLMRHGNGQPDPRSAFFKAAERSFGSYEGWLADFVGTSKMRGIGWAVCSQNPSNHLLCNHWISSHEIGAIAGFSPVLVLDLWEHAYLLDHPPAERPKYVDAFFANVNWRAVEERMGENRRT